VNKRAEAMLASLAEELAGASGEDKLQREAKSLFRLLNYCPPEHDQANQRSLSNAGSKDGI
jgi:hypothetical protein